LPDATLALSKIRALSNRSAGFAFANQPLGLRTFLTAQSQNKSASVARIERSEIRDYPETTMRPWVSLSLNPGYGWSGGTRARRGTIGSGAEWARSFPDFVPATRKRACLHSIRATS
jgi:hypothetical protein